MFQRIISIFSVVYMSFFIVLWLTLSLMGYEESLPASYLATFFFASLLGLYLRRWWAMRDNSNIIEGETFLLEGTNT